MADVNRSWRLAARPQGMIKDSDFAWREEPVPEGLGEGEMLVRTLYLSVDPTQRGWMEMDTYMPAIGIGEVVRAGGVGRVVRSNAPGFSPGDLVSGLVGWQDYAVMGSTGFVAPFKLPPGVPPTMALSLLGLTGLTAYFGLLEVGRPKETETVVVSGAAGATGMVVGQIAKIKGCRAIGIAGGPDKCSFLTGELGYDAAIDYKSEDVAQRLRELCPKGIDVYFDNVGGDILEAALGNLAMRGRVVLCGAISGYNDMRNTRGPRNYLSLLIQRGRMEGFIVTDFAAKFGDAVREMAGWVAAGRIKDRVDVVEGLEQAPAALRRLFTGANVGKQLVKVSD
ncbi:NADP-dependent oxidoreductase [Polyangium aurulentum]|uniref:NADP-dependent oxidoreductase n=1 Tax=Polyangium aurulentum TaxID=2567896 RepID=UPI0010AE3B7E|nr:NADP-dependent oxidoreductase [Polyangium aurulentum]UQA58316.1 NADP-dependent oxidoreductase [Polyangium aurulentum]